mmetsp:Transcript_7286/g.18993  ORF Transcript_7286/g.18993 Transcript_7286/m.18993 type:complete len:87 (+) Transcript_7286:332-592(+)
MSKHLLPLLLCLELSPQRQNIRVSNAVTEVQLGEANLARDCLVNILGKTRGEVSPRRGRFDATSHKHSGANVVKSKFKQHTIDIRR